MVENYDDSAMAKDAEFAERIAARLRVPEQVHPSFLPNRSTHPSRRD